MFLTVQSIQKRRGGMTVAVTAIVIAIVVVVNLLAAKLPSAVREFDISGSKLYTVSDATKDYLSDLDEDIELILGGEEASIDERITKFVNKSAGLSSHITVKKEDPVLYPSVLEKYNCSADTLVVRSVSSEKQTAVPFSGQSDALIIYAPDYNTFSYQESQFDAEGQITSAIDLVTGNPRTRYMS